MGPPVAWDRLKDALQPQSTAGGLSVVALGEVHAEALEPLTRHFQRVEQLVLDVPPRAPLASHRAEFNRAVDAATNDWLLIVREREVVDEPLAVELASVVASAKARGFRIRSVPIYAGGPLAIDSGESDVRLFHRRYYLRYANEGEWQQLAVQGTVVRLEGVLRAITFESAAAHHAYLEKHGTPRSALRRAARFLRTVIATGALDRNTLGYLWIEAGFEVGGR